MKLASVEIIASTLGHAEATATVEEEVAFVEGETTVPEITEN